MKKYIRNNLYYFLGILFLLLAKLKKSLIGYTPKPYSKTEINTSIFYDMEVADNWIKQLEEYLNKDKTTLIKDKSILELGPGADLGIGLYLLSKSARKYTAVDIHDNAVFSKEEFYKAFFNFLKEKENKDTSAIESEYKKLKENKDSRLNFVRDEDFNIVRALKNETVDYIFSHAAFEHFTDVAATIKYLSRVSKKGTVFVAFVDLKTHSRWIGRKDPNNIYRYSKRLYKILTNESSPNRVRPYEYKKLLHENGWNNIIIKKGLTLSDTQAAKYTGFFNKKFQDPINDMNCLCCTVIATKS